MNINIRVYKWVFLLKSDALARVKCAITVRSCNGPDFSL